MTIAMTFAIGCTMSTNFVARAQIKIFVGDAAHGLRGTLSYHGFKIRITCSRIVPKDVAAAAWDDLLEKLCEIDRSVIQTRMSNSQPLSYVSKDGERPALRRSRSSAEGTPKKVCNPGFSLQDDPRQADVD